MSRRVVAGVASQTLDVTDAHRINFSWLLRLRWWSIGGEALTIVVVDRGMGIPLPLAPLFAIVGLGVATNLGALAYARRFEPRPGALAAVMLLDVLLLTSLLYFTGGPFNPFSFLYLVQIALAAVVLPEAFTWLLAAASGVGSALLFLDHRELVMPQASHDEHMQVHLRGMWVAFVVAASFIVSFLLRVRKALALRERQLERARNVAAKHDKLVALGTLAAGAAHELSTPLSTITLVAKELEHQIPTEDALARDDIRLIRAEVGRCRAILEQMASDAGQTSGEAIVAAPIGALLEEVVAEAKRGHAISLRISDDLRESTLEVPRRAFVRALAVLVNNALDATTEAAEVSLGAGHDGETLLIEVRDRGAGMSPDVLARVGEPFFTTKEPGRGMGLGLFVSRAVIERMGGRLEFQSTAGEGTVASVHLPLQQAAAASFAVS